jgi:AraC family transcriptional regulator of adaptative response/methylated-DNA-[protein]-cysteine methyltransferase
MSTQAQLNYYRIAEAITYLQQNFKAQPDLDEVAKKVNLSPFHFQRLFTEWAGVSPKKFLQYLSLNYAKDILKDQQVTLFEAAYETGLSGTGRLHDLFVNIEGMTPGEFKNGGENLNINYDYTPTPFGNLLVASTQKGVCYMAFADDETIALNELNAQFSKAKLIKQKDELQKSALQIFSLKRHIISIKSLGNFIKNSER